MTHWGVEELSVQLDGVGSVGGPLAESPPVIEFGFWDRRDAESPAPVGYFCVGSLQAVNVVLVGPRGYGDGEVVYVREHYDLRYC